MKKNRRIFWYVLLVGILCVIGIGIWYVNDYYHSETIVETYLEGNEKVSVNHIADGLFLDGPGTESAMIFYPGAKVEYTAYLPLYFDLAELGMDCFLMKNALQSGNSGPE